MTQLIAEACCNHMGRVDLAHAMIEAACACGVRHIKFQKRCPRECLPGDRYKTPHPYPENAFGTTYGAHREFLELPVHVHRKLITHARALGMEYGCSVWDLTSAKEISGLRPGWIKLPSACNNHWPMINWLLENYQGQIHISLGMTEPYEEEMLVEALRKTGRFQDVILMACTSGYPVMPEETFLLEIPRLIGAYGKEAAGIGYSGHHQGTVLDIAASALGAVIIERHFTLNKSFKGTDHAASLEPGELAMLARNLFMIAPALKKKPDIMCITEQVQRLKLKYGGEYKS